MDSICRTEQHNVGFSPSPRRIKRTEQAKVSESSVKLISRIILPTAFPYDSPTLVLSSPKRLPGFKNDISLEQLGSSHNFHLNGKRGNGISICYASCSWKPNSCISLIILKAVLWCTAYGRYLTDGRCIDEHLIEIRREIEEESHG